MHDPGLDADWRHERRNAPARRCALALIGEQARRTRRPLPGFVNPLLFALARKAGGSRGPVFRDIRTGSNDRYDVGCCRAGRNYHAASGLGSLGVRAFMEEALGEPR